MKSKGFTLIELMIVVAIIAIIAAIAIPNLLRSRMAANETAAVAACKAFATAENIYRRTDYNQDGVLEYAKTLSGNNSLLETVAGSGDLSLIDRSFGAAEGTGTPSGVQLPPSGVPKAGYNFSSQRGIYENNSPKNNFDDSNGRRTLGYALYACPNQYDGTGRNHFQISDSGTIWQKDMGANSMIVPFMHYQVDSTWVVAE